MVQDLEKEIRDLIDDIDRTNLAESFVNVLASLDKPVG